jgi:DNA replication and repair protein RecF
VQVTKLVCTNFRAFDKKEINFSERIVFVEGNNGTGKTSLLEALYYACFLRSFRSSSPRQIVRFGQPAFHIALTLEDNAGQTNLIEIGFSAKKRIVKLNGKIVSSFKELIDCYRVVIMTEDDLSLIKGSPEQRRSFLDHGLLLVNADYPQMVRTYKKVLEQRNAFLHQGGDPKNAHGNVWTQKLWEQAQAIATVRIKLLERCQERVNKLVKDHFEAELHIACKYITTRYTASTHDYQEFVNASDGLFAQEQRFGRTQFGTHLDDIDIQFAHKKSRLYASRGQQKLVALLLKVALLQEVCEQRGPTLLLLDDFVTDFDQKRQQQIANLIAQLDTQTIFTHPAQSSVQGFIEKERKSCLVKLAD